VFTQKHAHAIAKKLGCSFRQGKAHLHADLFVEGKLITSFGIRRASKEVGHGHIPRDLNITQKQSRDLHDCSFSKEEYLAVLREKNLLTGPSSKAEDEAPPGTQDEKK
jgi:hypothetical protein